MTWSECGGEGDPLPWWARAANDRGSSRLRRATEDMMAAKTTETACAVCGKTLHLGTGAIPTKGGFRHADCSPSGVPVEAQDDPAACPAVLELVDAGGRTSGTAPCTQVGVHDQHEARWAQAAGDERHALFRADEYYDLESRSLRLVEMRPAASKTKKAKPAPAEPAPVTGVAMLPLSRLRESPTNARRTWGDMTELTASVARLGVLQPVLARPVAGVEDLELVFGHRRFRAAKAAKLDAIPVMVRALSDLEALEAQVVENVARQDVHPLEEAEGYEMLHDTHHLDVDTIAAKVGKSKAYVYARMKLLALCPGARKAFYDGTLSASVALLVARVPAAMQPDALEQLAKHQETWAHQGAPLGFRDAAALLEERYTLDLSRAPFDRKDLTLVPGAGACPECPKRAGNQKGLFDGIGVVDELDADVCTDPTCFAEKKKAHASRLAAKLETRGIEVVKGKTSKFGGVQPPKGFVTLDRVVAGKRVEDLVEKARAKKSVPEAIAKKTMMVGDGGKAVEIVREQDLRDALGLKEKPEPKGYDWRAEAEKRKVNQAVHDAASARVFATVVEKVEAMDGAPTAPLLRLLAREALATGVSLDQIAARRKWTGKKQGYGVSYDHELARMDTAELLGVLTESLLWNDDERDTAKGYEDLGKLFKLDVAAIAKNAREDMTRQVAPEADEENDELGKPARKAKKSAAKKGGKK